MKINIFIFILAFIIKLSTSEIIPEIVTIDLEFDENIKYRIRGEEDGPIKALVNDRGDRSIIPKKYFDLIKTYFTKNKFKCSAKYVYSGGLYETFYCNENNAVDYSKIKLYYNFENSTVILKESQLFETKGDKHYSKLRTQDSVNILTIGTR